jgi:hypothetical protein
LNAGESNDLSPKVQAAGNRIAQYPCLVLDAIPCQQTELKSTIFLTLSTFFCIFLVRVIRSLRVYLEIALSEHFWAGKGLSALVTSPSNRQGRIGLQPHDFRKVLNRLCASLKNSVDHDHH